MGQEASQPAATTPRPLITQSVDDLQLTRLRGNTHPLARPEFNLGTAPATLPMDRMLLVLKRSPEQETALARLLDDQQDKASPNYHKWLTPEEFGHQFGPTDTDIQTITAWLQSHGFAVVPTKGRTVLEFSGSASQVQEAFHTTIHRYIVNGEQHWANASDPQIPTALAPAVAGIDSLHDFRRKAMNTYVGSYSQKTRHLTTAKPEYSFPGCGSSDCFGLVPYDFATIYDVLPLWTSGIDGTGQTIAIVGRTNINPEDATDFWQLFGLTVPPNKLNVILNGPDPGINGDEGEADIDVQWSGAVAPQATIDLVASSSTETTDGIDLSAVYIVDNNLAPVMSESYGECELGLGSAGNQFYSRLWEQAAAQGISVFVSSGDNGAAGCDNPGGPAQYGLNVNGIASTPFNAAVGGTDFNQYNKWTTYWNSTNDPTTQASAKGYIPETTWNDSCTNALAVTLGYGTTAEQACNNPNMIQSGGVNSTAGSGGPSNCVVNSQTLGSCSQGYAKPSWQSGSGVPNDHRRDLPDISLFASNGFLGSFYLVCQRDQTGVCNLNSFAGYGGTSVASPAFAGIMSLVSQKIGTPQGIPGFVLYKLVSKQANAFHDVPSGSTIAMPCYSGSPNCTVSTLGDSYGILSGYSTGSGYDLATGLGSVDAANLVNNWTKATFTATTAILQLNSGTPVSVTHGTAVPVNIGVNPTAATGDASLLVSTGSGTTTGQAIDRFTLSTGTTGAGVTTSLLPGGTYNVIAHYAGDATYGGSYSTPVSVTVSKENSQPQVFLVTFDTNGHILSNNTSTTTYGTPYLLRVNVENSAGKLCAPVGTTGATGCPSGQVTLTNNGTALDAGAYTLNSYGYLEDLAVQLPGGKDSVTAAYAGDNSFNATTVTSTISITPAPTTMAPPTGSPATILAGSTTFFYAMVQSSSSGAVPTGTVTLYANGIALPAPTSYSGTAGAFNQGASLTAFFQPTFTTSGTKTITASYSGDGNYASFSSSATSVSVLYPTTETLTSSAQVVSAGTAVTLTALVDTTQKNLPPSGTFTFYDTNGVVNATPTITQVTDSSGYSALKATLTVTITSTIDFSFHYSGDSNYAGNQSNDIQIGVPGFSIFPFFNGVTITAGQTQQLGFNINALYGFTGTVGNFTCSGLPAEATCSFNPTQLTNSGTTTLTITTAALGQAAQRASSAPPQRWWFAEAGLLIGVCLIRMSKRRREAAIVMLICALVLLPSCGGASGGAGGGGGGTTPNPTPSITSLSPSQIAAGSTSVPTVVVNGSGFIAKSTVTYGGIQHPSITNNSNQIGLELSANDVATLGKLPVVVMNPSPGGGASNSMDFNVTTGTPTGFFTITVTATSGSVSHTGTFYLTVQ